ncbi:YHYH domain-containing protein [Hymenobacter norwichensis]|uniref:YHYH domain-containing protein n=1 Tax=Hymenobacter norwichensis TaxID=223903 RepID=UPI0012F9649C
MKLFFKLSIFVFLICSALNLSAHSGGLDSNGGHHNHKSGGYHYHRGVRGNMGWIALGGAAIVFFILKSRSNK